MLSFSILHTYQHRYSKGSRGSHSLDFSVSPIGHGHSKVRPRDGSTQHVLPPYTDRSRGCVMSGSRHKLIRTCCAVQGICQTPERARNLSHQVARSAAVATTGTVITTSTTVGTIEMGTGGAPADIAAGAPAPIDGGVGAVRDGTNASGAVTGEAASRFVHQTLRRNDGNTVTGSYQADCTSLACLFQAHEERAQ